MKTKSGENVDDLDNFRFKTKEQLTAALDVLAKGQYNMSLYRDGYCREFAHALLALLPDNTGRLQCGKMGSTFHYVVEAFGTTWDIGGPNAKESFQAWYREEYPDDRPDKKYRWFHEEPFCGYHSPLAKFADGARLQLLSAALTGKDVGWDFIDKNEYLMRRVHINEMLTSVFEQHQAKSPITPPDEARIKKLTAGFPFLGHETDRDFAPFGRVPSTRPIKARHKREKELAR